LCLGTVVVFANPTQFATALWSLEDFARHYLWSTSPRMPSISSGIRFPEVWSTISEARRLGWTDSLQQILPDATLALIGLAGFALLGSRRWRRMAPLAPLLALGMLPFVSSRRFIFYLAPFVGIGWGHIAALSTQALLDRFAVFRRPALGTGTTYLAVIGV